MLETIQEYNCNKRAGSKKYYEIGMNGVGTSKFTVAPASNKQTNI